MLVGVFGAHTDGADERPSALERLDGEDHGRHIGAKRLESNRGRAVVEETTERGVVLTVSNERILAAASASVGREDHQVTLPEAGSILGFHLSTTNTERESGTPEQIWKSEEPFDRSDGMALLIELCGVDGLIANQDRGTGGRHVADTCAGGGEVAIEAMNPALQLVDDSLGHFDHLEGIDGEKPASLAKEVIFQPVTTPLLYREHEGACLPGLPSEIFDGEVALASLVANPLPEVAVSVGQGELFLALRGQRIRVGRGFPEEGRGRNAQSLGDTSEHLGIDPPLPLFQSRHLRLRKADALREVLAGDSLLFSKLLDLLADGKHAQIVPESESTRNEVPRARGRERRSARLLRSRREIQTVLAVLRETRGLSWRTPQGKSEPLDPHPDELPLHDLLRRDLIVDLASTTKAQALDELCELLASHPNVTDPSELRDAIFEREGLVSTAIGLGVAVPHAKIPSVSNLAIAVGRLPQGVDFNALDREPVRLVFMIGASEHQASEFVKVLARVVRLVKRADTRERLLEASLPDEFHEIVRDTPLGDTK